MSITPQEVECSGYSLREDANARDRGGLSRRKRGSKHAPSPTAHGSVVRQAA
jgi:hypothetical protein